MLSWGLVAAKSYTKKIFQLFSLFNFNKVFKIANRISSSKPIKE